MSIVVIAFQLVLLHRIDGGEVIVNPALVTSLRSTPGQFSKLVPNGACLVGLSDGKFVSVIEPCNNVKRLIEEAIGR